MATYQETRDKILALHGANASVELILREMMGEDGFGSDDWSAVLESLTAEYIQLNTTPTEVPLGAGIMSYNADDDCLDVQAIHQTIQVGQELSPLMRNGTGAQIDNFRAVMFAGAVGNSSRIKIAPAIADGSIDSFYILGVTTEDIANGLDGHVTAYGKVRGIDTTGALFGETWADGDRLYVSPVTAGYLTSVPPDAPNLRIAVAVVVTAHSNGTIFVRPVWGQKMMDLDDVNGAVQVQGDFLTWNTAQQYFETGKKVGDGTNYAEFESTGFQLCVGAAKYWRDIDFPIMARTPVANQPTMVAIQGNITAPQWAVNDYLNLEGQELVHEWEEGTEVFWHLHLYTNGLEATDKYVRFTVEYTWANNNSALSAAVVADSGDLLIPANTTSKSMMIMAIGSFTPVGGRIAAHVIPQLKRIAATGAAPLASPWIDKLQLHIQCDTLGSRNIGTK